MDITEQTLTEKAYSDIVNYIVDLEELVLTVLATGGKTEFRHQEEILASIKDGEHPRAVAIGEALNILANSLSNSK